VRDRPVSQRFRDLSFDSLRKEARLRLLICSIPLVRESPLIGHGLYAFQYAYPKVQGDYFAKHPDSRLGFTNKRSHMAHNEYLQVLVEQGLVGLVLLLAALGEVVMRGRRAREGLPGEARALHAAFGFAALGLGLGAAVDFPFHVPQLVLPWMFCLAAFGAMVPARESPGQEDAARLERAGPVESPRTLRIDRVFGLTIAGVAIFLVPMGNFFFAHSLATDTRFLHASSYLEAVRRAGPEMDRERKLAALENVIRGLRQVVLTEPSHGHARFLLGQAHQTLGTLLAAEAAGTEGAPARLAALEAARAHELAIQYLRESMKHPEDASFLLRAGDDVSRVGGAGRARGPRALYAGVSGADGGVGSLRAGL
jgi:hypothetical protein